MDMQADLFGTLPDGREVLRLTVSNRNGLEISFINFGAALQRVRMPDDRGHGDDILLGYDNLEGYWQNPHYFGVTVGRYAGRITRARFQMDRKSYVLTRNHGKHHLHGGERGLSRVLWDAEPFRNGANAGVIMRYVSPEGEEGYPGVLKVKVVFELSPANVLEIRYQAVSNHKTPVSLTNHAYWNLAGSKSGTICDHHLRLAADHFLETDDDLLPTGEFVPVESGPDFRRSRRVGEVMERFGAGLDHCFVMARQPDSNPLKVKQIAVLSEPASRRQMALFTDAPCMQLYTGNFIEQEIGLDGITYRQHAGLCMETQRFPDAMNQSTFPNSFMAANWPYRSSSRYIFSVL